MRGQVASTVRWSGCGLGLLGPEESNKPQFISSVFVCEADLKVLMLLVS